MPEASHANALAFNFCLFALFAGYKVWRFIANLNKARLSGFGGCL
jgi:hypothetical protein